MSKWPFPGDLPVDRARQVAQQYRDALWQADREACRVLDNAATSVGEGWVVGNAAIEDEDDLVSVARAAELVGRSKRWVYALIASEEVRCTYMPMRVRLGDLQDAVAQRRASR